MKHSRPDVADVFRVHGAELPNLSSHQRRVARAITRCRTAAVGGHVRKCEECGHSEIQYNSCRNRHCPKCGGLKKARWVEARKEDVLPVEYHHVVFTIPEELHPLFLANPALAYGLLFSAVAGTLSEVAENPRNLGARVGFTAVLHTWTQLLLYHPHVHCIVPGGGPSPAGDQWISAKPGFFLPVKVLSLVFRGKLLSALEEAHVSGDLRPPRGSKITALLADASRKSWVIYSKPPLAGADHVIDYLSRYTNRIAISNDRLVSLADGKVTFRWRDRAHGNQSKFMTVGAVQFLRRFLLHVLPRGLMRIRHYGFLANSVRRRKIARCRDLLAVSEKEIEGRSSQRAETWQELLLRLTGRDVSRCPQCNKGRMEMSFEIPPSMPAWELPGRGAVA